MKDLKFLFGSLVVILTTVIIYSCAKDEVKHADLLNQNVELRSRCGDNSNVAPTPDVGILPSENGLCCYSFSFSGIPNGLGFTIYGLNSSGTFVGGAGGYSNYCYGTLDGTTIIKCCLPKSVKTITIVLSNGSCVSLNLPPGDC